MDGFFMGARKKIPSKFCEPESHLTNSMRKCENKQTILFDGVFIPATGVIRLDFVAPDDLHFLIKEN